MAELSKLFVEISTKLDTKGLDQTVNAIKDAEKKIKNVSDGFKTAGIALTAFATGGVVMINNLVKSIAGQELAEAKLNNALKTAGIYTKSLSEAYVNYAVELQKTLKYSDDAVISAQALLTQLGVMPNVMNQALTATADLSSALGMDLQSAATLVGKAAAGNTAMFSRYGIVLDEVKVKSQGFSYVLGEINKKFGGAAQAEALTFTGAVQKLGNAFEELKESLGIAILPQLLKLVNMLQGLVDWFGQLSPGMKSVISNTLLWGTTIAWLSGSLLLLIGYLPKVVMGITLVANTAKIAISMFNPWTLAIAAVTIAIGALLIKFSLFQNEVKNNTVNSSNYIETMKRELDAIKKEQELFKNSGAEMVVYKGKRIELNKYLKITNEVVKDYERAIGEAEKSDKKNTDTVVKGNKDKQASAEEYYSFLLATQQVSLTEYKALLESQIAIEKDGTERMLRLRRELYDVNKKLNDTTNYEFKSGWANALREVENQQTNWADKFVGLITDVKRGFSSAFFMMLSDGTNFFDAMSTVSDVLKSAMIKNIADIAAEWVIQTGIMKAATVAWAAIEWAAAQMVAAARTIAGWATIPWIGAGLGIAAALALMAQMGMFKFLAQGGMATGATPAIIGEAGPELVLPLQNQKTTQLLSEAIDRSETNIGGHTININISDSILSNRSMLRQNAKLIAGEIMQDLKLNTKVR